MADHSPCCELLLNLPTLAQSRSSRLNLICSCSSSEASRLCLCTYPLPVLCEKCYESAHQTHESVCVCWLSHISEQALFQRKDKIARVREIRRKLEEGVVKEVEEAINTVHVTLKQGIDILVRESGKMIIKLQQWKDEIEAISRSLIPLQLSDKPIPPTNVFEALIADMNFPVKPDYFHPMKIALACPSTDIPNVIEKVWDRLISLQFDLPLRPSGPAAETCASCDKRISSMRKIFHRRIILSCGHCFHSKDCLLEYTIFASRSFFSFPITFRCPRCWAIISDGEMEQYLGSDFKRIMRLNRNCCICKATKNLHQRSQPGHYLCSDCKETNDLKITRPCLCQNSSIWFEYQ